MEADRPQGKVDDMMFEKLGENYMNTRFTDKSTLLIIQVFSEYVYLVKTSINFKVYGKISSKNPKLLDTCLSNDIFAACLLASVHTLKGMFTKREEDAPGRS